MNENQFYRFKFLRSFDLLKIQIKLIIVLQILHFNLDFSSPFVINRTDPEKVYVVRIPLSEVDNLRVARQQNNGNEGTAQGQEQFPPRNTASNVVQILAGLFNEDVRPIIHGGTNFIPGDELREGVEVLLHHLAPNLQNILFGPNRPLQTQQTTVVRQMPEDSSSNGVVPNVAIVEVTTINPSIVSTFEEEETTIQQTTPIPSSTPILIITPQPTTIKTTAIIGNSNFFYFRQPNESHGFIPQSAIKPNIPISSKFPLYATNHHIPESSKFQVHTVTVDEALSKAVAESITMPPKNGFEIIRESVSPTENPKPPPKEMEQSPISTTEKQYLYLVLNNEEYEEFTKYANNKNQPQQVVPAVMATPAPAPSITVFVNYSPTQDPAPLPLVEPLLASTTDASDVIIAASETTPDTEPTVDPDPRLPGNEGDDDDDDDNLVDRVIASITS